MIDTISNVLQMVSFEVHKQDDLSRPCQLMLRSLDPTHVCFIWVSYPVQVSPRPTDTFVFKLNVRLFQKALKKCPLDGVLELILTDEHLEVKSSSSASVYSALCELTHIGDDEDDCVLTTAGLSWKHWISMPVDNIKQHSTSAKDFDCNCISLLVYNNRFEIALKKNGKAMSRLNWRTSKMIAKGCNKRQTYQIDTKSGDTGWNIAASKLLLQLDFQEDLFNRIFKSMAKTNVELRLGRVVEGQNPPLAIIHSIGQGVGSDAAVVKFFLAPQVDLDDHMSEEE